MSARQAVRRWRRWLNTPRDITQPLSPRTAAVIGLGGGVVMYYGLPLLIAFFAGAASLYFAGAFGAEAGNPYATFTIDTTPFSIARFVLGLFAGVVAGLHVGQTALRGFRPYPWGMVLGLGASVTALNLIVRAFPLNVAPFAWLDIMVDLPLRAGEIWTLPETLLATPCIAAGAWIARRIYRGREQE